MNITIFGGSGVTGLLTTEEVPQRRIKTNRFNCNQKIKKSF